MLKREKELSLYFIFLICHGQLGICNYIKHAISKKLHNAKKIKMNLLHLKYTKQVGFHKESPNQGSAEYYQSYN